MTLRWLAPLLIITAACGDPGPAAMPIDGPVVDAASDAPVVDAPACVPQMLLVGGQPVEPQGWAVVQSGMATLTLGADFTQLATATVGTAGAHLLLARAATIDPAQPFAISVELQVQAVAPHNPLDAAAAVLTGFSASFGTTAQRGQMLYLDPAQIGWADDSARFAAAVVDGAYHTVRLDYDGAGGLQVRLDGTLALTRAGVTPNDTLAIGDQSNEPNLESTVRIRAVVQHCL